MKQISDIVIFKPQFYKQCLLIYAMNLQLRMEENSIHKRQVLWCLLVIMVSDVHMVRYIVMMTAQHKLRVHCIQKEMECLDQSNNNIAKP